MNKWQPIETATKDGSAVYLRNIDNGLSDVGYWCDYSEFDWTLQDGEWSQLRGNGEMTHWMPLPEPPEVEE